MENIDRKNTMVSVFCIAYNHEKYIQKCIDGLLMQKTNFQFEIIIHDDASTDKTADIVRKYEKKFPSIIRSICQIENQYSKGVSIIPNFILPKANGKYIAFCEGDDFWTDPFKLQKQYDVMENNQSLHMCIHRTSVVSEDGNLLGMSIPVDRLSTGVISPKQMVKRPCHFSSFFVRVNDFWKLYDHDTVFFSSKFTEDGAIQLFFANLGDNYYFDELMSCYRKGSICGWTQRFNSSQTIKRQFWENDIEGMYLYNRYTEYKFDDYCKKEILTLQLRIFRCGGPAKTVRKSDCKSAYKNLSTKDKVIFIGAWFPFVFRLYDRVFRKKDEVRGHAMVD